MSALTHCQKSGEAGFTLLEVVIATAIMALAFGTLYPIFASIPSHLARSQDREAIVAYGESVMQQQILLHNWSALPASGTEGEWQWEASEVPLTGLPKESIPGRPLHLRVTVTDTKHKNASVSLDQILWVQE
ncbi:type II secretion system protein [Kordiimonas marina]|uniref:type II secretion system protein n=1 Tax=Kordiimonas marina TaxID=2872312 RepID=UPI003CCFE5F2|nr:prepilin-type N-terminal cleavage/methylation domain-containing protein [Kordiimonas marina]